MLSINPARSIVCGDSYCPSPVSDNTFPDVPCPRQGHALHLEVDLPVLLVLVSAAIPGSHLGAKQTGRFSADSLRRCMGGVMVLTAPPIFWLAYTQQ